MAIKGLGGFHLAVDALQEEAVKRLRQRKHREEKPLALMCPDLDRVRQFARIEAEEEAVLRLQRAPDCTAQKKGPRPHRPRGGPGQSVLRGHAALHAAPLFAF